VKFFLTSHRLKDRFGRMADAAGVWRFHMVKENMHTPLGIAWPMFMFFPRKESLFQVY